MSLLVKLINLLVDGGLDLVLMMDPLNGILKYIYWKNFCQSIRFDSIAANYNKNAYIRCCLSEAFAYPFLWIPILKTVRILDIFFSFAKQLLVKIFKDF